MVPNRATHHIYEPVLESRLMKRSKIKQINHCHWCSEINNSGTELFENLFRLVSDSSNYYRKRVNYVESFEVTKIISSLSIRLNFFMIILFSKWIYLLGALLNRIFSHWLIVETIELTSGGRHWPTEVWRICWEMRYNLSYIQCSILKILEDFLGNYPRWSRCS